MDNRVAFERAGFRFDEVAAEDGDKVLWRGLAPNQAPVWLLDRSCGKPDSATLARFNAALEMARRAGETICARPAQVLTSKDGETLVAWRDTAGGAPQRLLSEIIPDQGMRLGPLIKAMLAIARAAAGLHAADLLGRDVRPARLLVTEDLTTAQFVCLDCATGNWGQMGQAASTFGASPRYAAPELSGRIEVPIDERADLYSIGVTFFEMIRGTVPFDEVDLSALTYAHVARTVPDVTRDRVDLPHMLASITRCLLQKEPDDRYASAYGLVQDLGICADQFERSGTIRAFDLIGRNLSPRFRLNNRLLGRKAEQAQLLDAARNGLLRDRRTLVSVVGPSGIGKTAFVSHMRWHLVEWGTQLHAGKFDRFQQDRPYVAFTELMQSIVRPMLYADQAILESYRDRLQTALGRHAGLLTELVPDLARLLGPQPKPEAIHPAEATRRFNGVVGRFIRAVATDESPLIIFLDDVQWADHASLNLLDAIAHMPDLRHFALVLGYRTNEIDPSHPAHQVLQDCRTAVDLSVEIPLGPLTSEDVADLAAASLGDDIVGAEKLARHVHEVSQGNPFFVREYLGALAASGALVFDREAGRWAFDSVALAETDMPESVAGFLTQRLETLPAETLEILDNASCIGSSFDLQTLAWVSGMSKPASAVALAPAIRGTILVPLDEEHHIFAALDSNESDDDDLTNAWYRFRHDQVRQAVHDRLAATARAQRHLQIARLMLKSVSEDALARRAVEIFGHVLWGAQVLTDPEEKLRYARLGLLAAEQAQMSLAFNAASEHLATARAMLGEGAWETQTQLICDVRRAEAKCAFALNDREAMEAAAREVLTHTSDPYDIADLQGMRIRYLTTDNQGQKAIDLCIEVAASLGVRLPRHPNFMHVLTEVVRILVLQGRTDPRQYAKLPDAENPRVRAAVRLMTQAAPAAYFTEPNLLPVLCISVSRLTIKHGLSPSAPYGIAGVALVLCAALNMIERGYKYGQLALEAGSRYGGTSESKMRFAVDSFVRHWKEPLHEVAAHLYSSWATNRDAGDQEDATYCAGHMLCADFLAGRRATAAQDHPEIMDFLRQTRMAHITDCYLAWGQLMYLLGADDVPEELSGRDFDYPLRIQEFENARNGVQIGIGTVAAAVLDHLAGRYQRAEERFALVARNEKSIIAQIVVPAYVFFRALNAYRLAEIDPDQAARLHRLARRHARRQKPWAKSAPVNLAHRVSLLEAERLVVAGHAAEALMKLHEACTLAGPEAHLYAYLAHRRRWQLLREAGHMTEAAEAARQACADADAWGAPGLANTMRAEAGLAATDSERSTSKNDLAVTDLKSFIALVGAISRETRRDQLLAHITKLALSVGNADFSAVALAGDDGVSRVTNSTDGSGAAEGNGAPLSTARAPLRPVIEFCLRTGEAFHSDAPQAEPFAKDIVETLPRALFCAPLVLGDKTLGALYLESRVSRYAFAPGRCELIQALANQAAVALENASLLRHLQQALASQTRQTEATRRFVPDHLMQVLGQGIITDVDLNQFAETEMTAVFVDIRGFTTIAHEIGAKRTIEMINRYLEHVQPGIAAHGGFVGNYLGDGLLALFPEGPDSALFGLSAMARGLAGYNANRGHLPQLAYGAGVHIGQLTVGMIGDPDHIQVGVLGDPVNVAARLESLNKRFGSAALVSAPCFERLVHKTRFALRPLGRTTVRGLESRVGVYELLDVYKDDQREVLVRTKGRFAEAVASFEAGQTDRAAALFEKVATAAAAAGGDPVAEQMIRRCRKASEDQQVLIRE